MSRGKLLQLQVTRQLVERKFTKGLQYRDTQLFFSRLNGVEETPVHECADVIQSVIAQPHDCSKRFNRESNSENSRAAKEQLLVM